MGASAKNRRSKVAVVFLIAAVGVGATFAEQEPKMNGYHSTTLSLDASTLGFGGSASLRLGSHFGLRGGMNYFSLSDDAAIEGIAYQANLRMLSEYVALDLYPSRKSSFHFSFGILLNQNCLSGNSGNDFTLGGFPADQVGSLQLKCEQQPVNPYASLGGNFYLGKARRWSLGVEAGVVYTGSPEVSLTRSGGISDPAIDDALEQERKDIEAQAEKWKIWPVLKLSLCYSF